MAPTWSVERFASLGLLGQAALLFHASREPMAKCSDARCLRGPKTTETQGSDILVPRPHVSRIPEIMFCRIFCLCGVLGPDLWLFQALPVSDMYFSTLALVWIVCHGRLHRSLQKLHNTKDGRYCLSLSDLVVAGRSRHHGIDYSFSGESAAKLFARYLEAPRAKLRDLQLPNVSKTRKLGLRPL